MIDILSKCPPVTVDLKGLVLQPMNGAALLRSWLYQNGWNINEEDLVLDEGRLYEVMYVSWFSINKGILLGKTIGNFLDKKNIPVCYVKAIKKVKEYADESAK